MSGETPAAVLAAFGDAIDYFHAQLDTEGERVAPDGRVLDRTPRDYFRDRRGWTDETLADARLGWAPTSRSALLDHLRSEGHDDAAILGTGLFHADDDGETPEAPHFRARYVFPYFDGDDRPVYAISRSADHPADPHPERKYTKAMRRRDYAKVSEPIYGLHTVEHGRSVLITEGIADAITAHQAGYPCVSPVTK